MVAGASDGDRALLAELASTLEDVSESLAELMLESLRRQQAAETTAARNAGRAEERRLARARRAVERAREALEEEPRAAPEEPPATD